MDPLTFEAVRADIAAELYLEPEEVPEAGNLFDEGLDSVRLLGLVAQWREHGATVSFAELAERPTLSAWWGVLSGTGVPDAR